MQLHLTLILLSYNYLLLKTENTFIFLKLYYSITNTCSTRSTSSITYFTLIISTVQLAKIIILLIDLKRNFARFVKCSSSVSFFLLKNYLFKLKIFKYLNKLLIDVKSVIYQFGVTLGTVAYWTLPKVAPPLVVEPNVFPHKLLILVSPSKLQ